MQKRILISGRNQMMINVFFQNMGDLFECQTTSARTEDVVCHLKYFKPELLVLCLNTGTKEILSEMVDICNTVDEQSIPVALIGDIKECQTLAAEMKTAPVLTFSRTSRATKIAGDINDYLNSRESQAVPEKPAEKAPVKVPERPAEKAPQKPAEAATEGRQKPVPPAAGEIKKPVEERAEQPGGEKTASRKHVTVIDDDYRMLRVLKEYLHDTYDVATALSGKLAMKFLESKHTDLILLDYLMPEENGPEVYKNIRALPGHKNTPIVFLTGVSESKKIKEVMELHPHGYLLKPVEREQFLKSIRNYLG